jgi:hypothetical protein
MGASDMAVGYEWWLVVVGWCFVKDKRRTLAVYDVNEGAKRGREGMAGKVLVDEVEEEEEEEERRR